MPQPNIVVVLVDQMRRDAMSCAGDPNVRTPHLDALAKRGTRFTAANATFPACVPFRFSMLTGQYAHTRNVPALGYRLSPAERTLGEAVAAQGFDTAYIGKWHLYSAYGVSGGLSLSQAARSPIPASHRRGFDYWRGFELRNDFYDSWIFSDDNPKPDRLPGHQTDALFDKAFEYIDREQSRDRSFFLILSVEAPHPPFTATPEHLTRVRARGAWQPRPNTDIDAIEFFPPEWYEADGPAGCIDPADPASVRRVFDANMQAYSAMIEQIDDNMGRLDECLAKANLRDNTIVVFLSDHGELAGSHGQLGKAQPWEESVGIPLIVSGPGVLAESVADMPVGTEDLFPTLVGLAGGQDCGTPGHNFAPFLRGAAAPDRDGVVLQFVTETRPGRGYYDETWRGIRTKRYKYTVLGDRSGAKPWQLFDLQADPYERDNLIADPDAALIAAEHHEKLSLLLTKTCDDYALAAAFDVAGQNCVSIEPDGL